MKPQNNSYYLIDPPISRYSSKGEIEAWIRQLEDMPANPEVLMALEDAKDMLNPDTKIGP
jgi:hypothetical protein